MKKAAAFVVGIAGFLAALATASMTPSWATVGLSLGGVGIFCLCVLAYGHGLLE